MADENDAKAAVDALNGTRYNLEWSNYFSRVGSNPINKNCDSNLHKIFLIPPDGLKIM